MAQPREFSRHRRAAIEVWHAAAAPVLELIWREQAHANENVHRRNDLALLEDNRDRLLDPRIEWVATKRGGAQRG
jgi:hypothetical protein